MTRTIRIITASFLMMILMVIKKKTLSTDWDDDIMGRDGSGGDYVAPGVSRSVTLVATPLATFISV